MLSHEFVVAFFINFIKENSRQIISKARFFNVSPDALKSTLFILIADRLHLFDSNRASAEAYFFGCLHAEFLRFLRDVNTHAKSLDDDSKEGIEFKNQVEYGISRGQQSTPCFTNTNGTRIVAGAANLLSLAEAASGFSASELGRRLGVSRRRFNQLRQAIENEAKNQFGLDFWGEEDEE